MCYNITQKGFELIMNWKIVHLDSVDSTNNEAKRRAQAGAEHGLVVISREQTAGKGRNGRSFQSPAETGLYLTALLRPDVAAADAVNLTAWAAVAVCDGVEAACGLRPGIKWPNDIILDNKKLCGILVESAAEGMRLAYAAVGIGVNVNQRPEDFDPAVRPVAVSLSMVLGAPVDVGALTGHLLRALERLCADFPHRRDRWLHRYRADCLTAGHQVRLIQGERSVFAFAEGIDDDFGLMVRYEDGRRETVAWGEVSVRGLLGYI
jgi:BirA family biotin operon repressor/biotin-[acetyl-CoA-carboxylase] ligase